jgi:hypothetical protein
MLRTCIQDEPSSRSEHGLFWWNLCLSSILWENFGVVTSVKPRPLPSWSQRTPYAISCDYSELYNDSHLQRGFIDDRRIHWRNSDGMIKETKNNTKYKIHNSHKGFTHFTFMLPCSVMDFYLNNQQDALIIQIYSVIKLYMFRASSLPIIRSFLLYIRHW